MGVHKEHKDVSEIINSTSYKKDKNNALYIHRRKVIHMKQLKILERI